MSSTSSLSSTHHITRSPSSSPYGTPVLHPPSGHVPLSLRLSSPARCSTTHLHLGIWSPSHLLLWPFLYPHIITLCHFTSILSQHSTHIFLLPALSRSPSICHVYPYGHLSSHLHIRSCHHPRQILVHTRQWVPL
jgi:hypothetical protein